MSVLVPHPLQLISGTGHQRDETQHRGISVSLMVHLQKWVFLAKEAVTGVVSQKQRNHLANSLGCCFKNGMFSLKPLGEPSCFRFRNGPFDVESGAGAGGPSFGRPPFRGLFSKSRGSSPRACSLTALAATCAPEPPARTALPWLERRHLGGGPRVGVVPSLLCTGA